MSDHTLHSLLDALEQAESIQDLQDCCERFCEVCRAPWYLMATIAGKSFAAPDIEVFCNYPRAWFDAYKAENKKKDDPVVRYVLKKNRPIIWSQLMEMPEYRGDINLELMQQAAEHGLANGITVPIRSAEGELGIFSLAIDNNGPEGIARLEAALPLVHTFATALCEHFIRICKQDAPAPGKPLTERQIECLFWAAEGKTTWEIAQIMSIKERTVEFHLQNSVEKLQASNRQHAVSIAIKMGLVGPKM